jgi:hypothetical protein
MDDIFGTDEEHKDVTEVGTDGGPTTAVEARKTGKAAER